MNRSTWRLVLVFLPLYAAAIFFAFSSFRALPEFLLQPVQRLGSPLRAGDRVYFLTEQRRERFLPKTADFAVDLWAFDATTATPVWRKRLEIEIQRTTDGISILGAQGDTLWLLIPKGLAAASLATGDLLADPATMEARNPSLRGLLPREARFFQFDAAGLQLRAADGRDWRVDARSFSVRPAETGEKPDTGAIAPAYFAPNGTLAFQERGLLIPGRWLGLLNNKEANDLNDRSTVGGLDGESRRRLWEARTKPARNIFGDYVAYSNFTPLGKSYLAPGLLSSGPGEHQPLLLRNPDSVLILYRDLLGEKGRLQVDRVAGPAGRILWTAPLPISVLQSVLPGSKSLVLYGM
ncbi:MAG: PA2928 family protein, partial [Bryobacteraceae bacterium]